MSVCVWGGGGARHLSAWCHPVQTSSTPPHHLGDFRLAPSIHPSVMMQDVTPGGGCLATSSGRCRGTRLVGGEPPPVHTKAASQSRGAREVPPGTPCHAWGKWKEQIWAAARHRWCQGGSVRDGGGAEEGGRHSRRFHCTVGRGGRTGAERRESACSRATTERLAGPGWSSAAGGPCP